MGNSTSCLCAKGRWNPSCPVHPRTFKSDDRLVGQQTFGLKPNERGDDGRSTVSDPEP